MMDIQISTEGLEHANKALQAIPGAFPRAVAAATNRVLEGMRTDAVTETAKKYFVKPSEIRKSLTLKKSSAGNLMGAMVSRGSRKSLADYQLTPKTPRKGKNGLQGAVKRDGVKNIERGFLLRRGSGYKPYMRVGSGKWAVQFLISPAIPQIVKNDETVELMREKAAERFEKRLDHEVLRLLGAFTK